MNLITTNCILSLISIVSCTEENNKSIETDSAVAETNTGEFDTSKPEDSEPEDSESEDTVQDTSIPDTSSTPVVFTEHIHSSLPIEWNNEYSTIKSDLLNLLPLYQTHYSDIILYALNNSAGQPYEGVSGGAYISVENGNPMIKRFVLEMLEADFESNSINRYTAIPHEYFHCYQMTLSEHMNLPNDHEEAFGIKWLVEGTAALFQGLYIRQHYATPFPIRDQNYVNIAVYNDPSLYETFENTAELDRNYSSSIFLVLTLAKELQASGLTEPEAFKRIFKEFLIEQPQNHSWEEQFQAVFGMSKSSFYTAVENYTNLDNEDLAPSVALTLEQIFE